MNFSQFEFQTDLQKGVTALGFELPTPIQEQTIPLLLQGRDVIGCAQTGTGKTAAYALPILQNLQPGGRKPQALIVAPTRELAEQIEQNLRSYARFMSIRCLAVYGGVGILPQELKLRKGIDILVATPGRLLDHLRRKTVKLDEVRFLVLDEADRMLDMGFLPDIQEIVAKLPQERQTLLFSATMPAEIEKLAGDITQQAETVVIGVRGSAADLVEQTVYSVTQANKMPLLLHLLKTQPIQSALIFARTKQGADRIASHLARHSVSVTSIHSDRSQAQRRQALDGFRKGKYKVLVATDVAARGLDVDTISHVINFDTPTFAEDYIHRIGRTGRASVEGEAWTFTSPQEKKHLRSIEKLLKRILPQKPAPASLALQAGQLVHMPASEPMRPESKDNAARPHRAKSAIPPLAPHRPGKPRGNSRPKREREAQDDDRQPAHINAEVWGYPQKMWFHTSPKPYRKGGNRRPKAF